MLALLNYFDLSLLNRSVSGSFVTYFYSIQCQLFDVEPFKSLPATTISRKLLLVQFGADGDEVPVPCNTIAIQSSLTIARVCNGVDCMNMAVCMSTHISLLDNLLRHECKIIP